jgi:hypothetical protein
MLAWSALLCLLPSPAQDGGVRALRRVWSTSELRSTVLPSNAGWQPIYSQQVDVTAGDLLRLVGQIQMTVDSTPRIGQQLRLTVNGEAVGSQAIEINTQPGSHHLPMFVSALYLAEQDGQVQVDLEGSSFHSDGDFPVTVDHADNLFYGSLMVDQYRSYPDLATAWADRAVLLNDVYQPAPLVKAVWGLAPYVQEPLASVLIPANQGDILRPSGEAVGMGTLGLEQFTGVLTVDGRAVSPYGGQDVLAENPTAPMLVEGVDQVAQDGQQFLEYRLYGAFGHGLTLLPQSPRFEVAHYASYGRQLMRFGQEQIGRDNFLADGQPVELFSQEIDLARGDLLRLTGNLQFGQLDQPADVRCRMEIVVEGPGGPYSCVTQKSLTPTKTVLSLGAFLTVRAPQDGRYRMLLRGSGQSESGSPLLRLDAGHSQLQYLQFGLPR